MPSHPLTERLREADPQPLGQRVPHPLHERVEALADRLYEGGGDRPTKAKLVAAILLAAPTDPTELRRLVARYESALVKDALIGTEEIEGDAVVYPERRPGPRRAKRTRSRVSKPDAGAAARAPDATTG